MSWLTNTLKNRRLMVAIGFILLILLILIIGALRLGNSDEPLLSLTERILCVVLVLLVALMLFMYERMQEMSRAKGMEQAFFSQAEDQKQSLTPSKRKEIEAFQKKLETAIDGLKRSKIGRGRRGAAALYALPWYLMIGPPGGGKSTAIKNSGMDFPAGVPKDDEVYGVGGTRNCEWFLSTEAILLDTAGRFVSVDEDREEWLTFLDILKKYRRKKPINGVLVGFSVKDLLEADNETLEQHAKKIRERIDELSKRLGIHFPVYLVFTKCDLLDGFADFFGDMNSREREQIWGCTYTQEQMKAAAADPRAVFNEELQMLLDSLAEMRTTRLHNAGKRRKVFLFPLQLVAVREKMAHFVGKLFQPNPYQDNPTCRGFYLTSATQNEGVPLDRAIEAISREFGLPPPPTEAGPADEIKHYFIKNLFTNVVIPDQNFLIGGTSRVAQAQRQLRLATMAGAALVLALFIVGVSFSCNKSEKSMIALKAAADSLKGLNAGSADYFERLQGLRNQLVAQEEQSNLLLLGMGRSGTVAPAAYGVYFKKLQPFVQENFYNPLSRRLEKVALNQPNADLDNAYNELMAYLLLNREYRRAQEEKYQNFLQEEIAKLAEPSGSASVKGDIVFFAQHFAEAVDNQQAQPFPVNETLVAGVRRRIKDNSDVNGLYQRLKRQVRGVDAVAFDESLLHSKYNVPGVFTKDGWQAMEKLIDKPSDEYSEEERWVLGIPEGQATDGKSKAMAATLKKLYFEEYARQWGQYLREMQYEPFADFDAAAERLKKYGDGVNSPIAKVLAQVAGQTNFKNMPGFVEKALQYLGANNQNARLFDGIQALAQGDKQEGLNQMLSQFAAVAGEMEKLAKDPSGSDAKDYAVKVIDESAELPKALGKIRETLGRQNYETKYALTALFETPLLQAWDTARGRACGYLNAQWGNMVYSNWQQIERSYPFNRRASESVQPNDLAAFFGPQGPLETFKKELSPFFKNDDYSQPRRWDGRSLGFSGQAQDAFQKSKALVAAMIPGGAPRVSFSIQMIKVEPKDKVDRICLAIGGRNECVKIEKKALPPPLEYEWPGSQPSSGAKLELWNEKRVLEDVRVAFQEKTNDPWGWFRLLEQWRPQPRGNSEYYCQVALKDRDNKDMLMVCSIRASSAMNPFSPSFFNFRFPAQLF